MAMASGIGAKLDAAPDDIPAHAFWFGEDQARYVVTVPAAKVEAVLARARAASVPVWAIGTTGGDALTLAGRAPHPGHDVARAFRRLAAGLYGRRAAASVSAGEWPTMAMDAGEIERLIKARIPDAQVTIRDLAGDGDHYAATVISASFKGKSRVQQHQLVYEALKGQMGGVLHALALQTGTP